MRGSFLGLITSNGPLLTTNWQKLSVSGMSDAPALDSSPSSSTRSTSFSTPPSNLYTAVQRWATRAFKKSGLHAVRFHSARTQVVVVALKSCKMLPVSAQRQCSDPHDLHMHNAHSASGPEQQVGLREKCVSIRRASLKGMAVQL